jgi:hypothetical protein
MIEQVKQAAWRPAWSVEVSDGAESSRPISARASAWLTGVLGTAAALAVGFGLLLAASPLDTEAIESPLLLAVARQLHAGPWGLYGPYGGQNPLVTIHAPLYYHLAALAAWPLYHLGLQSVSSALLAGRFLSILAYFGTLLAAYRIARLDGAPRRAGLWAAFLIAATPVLAGVPFEVRPDMLGILLQTTGVLCVLAALHSQNPGAVPLLPAFAGFALAVCVKQTFVAPALVSTTLLVAAWRRGRIDLARIERGLLLAFLIVFTVYGIEEFATAGRMSQAVLEAALEVPKVHPGSWPRAFVVGYALLHRSVTWVVPLAAAGTALLAARRSFLSQAFALASALLVALVVALVSLELVVESNIQRTWLTGAALLSAFVVVPICALAEPGPRPSRRLDASLWLYLFAELALTAFLSRSSTGAWLNYAIQSVVLASIITARALTRAIDAAASKPLLIIGLAVLLPLVSVSKYVYRTAREREIQRLALSMIFEHLRCSPSETFFVDRPGDNRIHGRLDLVYDDWAYAVFESLRLAEPRVSWLGHALRAGPVRYVINTSDQIKASALPDTFPRMGYVASIQVGPFYVWERVRPIESSH